MVINEQRMFGDIFKELRVENQLSQKGIADKLDISQALIGKWENHQSTPSPEMLDFIADIFNVSTDYLLGRTNTKNWDSKKSNIDNDDILFSKYKQLTNEDKELIKSLIEIQHKKIDKQLGEE